ncbi:helix-turn-helix domain-containing protein [Flagellimonas algicola]|uniref:Helix-turn-helix transcriptional regulator n=1 Tax=Flagellimonas algicola TaxID=2583815 RepID=A0ABY2WQV0_9FLAO|nr:helix-turn-helix transcriptional regulator [Allomuricauda algicola]TMU57373.1 helix-turn-helix transcriptional regulator [Allomuricauda algicola]
MKYPEKEELLRNLALRVKELRKIKDVTQEEALHDTGIQFSRIEQGKRDVQLSTILKLCHYFEISMAEFFDDTFEN